MAKTEDLPSGVPATQHYTSTALFRVMHPLLVILKVSGLFHTMPARGGRTMPARGGRTMPARGGRTASEIYCSVCLTLSWLNTLRICSSFKEESSFNTSLLMKFLAVAWHVLCSVNCTALFWASHKSHCLPEFFCTWQRLNGNMAQNPDLLHYMRRRMLLFLSAFIGVFLINFVYSVYAVWFTNILDYNLAPMTAGHPYTVVVRPITFILKIYDSLAWIFPIAFHAVICTILYSQFQSFNKDFAEHVGDQGNFQGSLEVFRQHHQGLCHMVHTADGFLSPHNAAVYACNLVMLCITFYNLIWMPEAASDPVILSLVLFWSLACIGHLTINAVMGSYINHVAHALVDHLHDMDLSHTSAEFNMQLSTFLSRLSGSSIGLTALDMFTIDKPTILTILGMVITYFVLLIQFKPSEAGITEPDNCAVIINATLAAIRP